MSELPACGTRCVCPKGSPGAAGPTAVRVARETKGRAGKGVTVVSGLPLPTPEIEALATKLKKRCGSGGTVREGVIEIQGEHRDVIVARAHQARIAGQEIRRIIEWCMMPPSR